MTMNGVESLTASLAAAARALIGEVEALEA